MSKKFHLDSVLLSHQAQNLLKSRTAALIADIGIKKASELCGVSTSTLKQYGGSRYEDFRRFMPINFVQLLEAESGLPCITSALAEVNGGQLVKRADFNQTDDPSLEAAFLKICSQCSTVISEAVRARAVSPLTKEQCADQLDRLSELEASLVSLKRFLAEV